MNKKRKLSLIQGAYALSKVVFWAHLSLLIILLAGNYFDPFGLLNNQKAEFTVRGNVGLVEDNWKPTKSPNQIEKLDSTNKEVIFLMQKSGFGRIDFTDMSEVFTFRIMAITLLDIASYWIWLVLTYQLMKIIASVSARNIFERRSIERLRIIAFIFVISPFIELIKNQMFAFLLASKVNIVNHSIFGFGVWDFAVIPIPVSIVKGFMMMVLILVLTEIFRIGHTLKQESDLTI